MAYTPVGWQTGDTITADRLNRMDRGWDVETTELFSETVTTVEDGDSYYAELAYSQLIDADTITVTYDGTEYTCPRIDNGGSCLYGGFNDGPDFTTYPFFIFSEVGQNQLITPTAGTHTVAVSAPSLQTSADFAAAVKPIVDEAVAMLPVPIEPFMVTIGTTTWSQVNRALKAGRPALVWEHNTINNQPDIYEFVVEAVRSTPRNVLTIAVSSGAVVVKTYQAASDSSALELVTS